MSGSAYKVLRNNSGFTKTHRGAVEWVEKKLVKILEEFSDYELVSHSHSISTDMDNDYLASIVVVLKPRDPREFK